MPERVSSHMTFRTRLVLAATVAVAVAVLLAAVVAFFAARSSLLASVDDTLSVEATAALQNPTGVNVGSYGEIGCFAPAGVTDQGSCSLPVTAQVEAVANGQAKVFFTTVEPTSGPYRGQQYREIVLPAPDADGAILLATPMAGVNSQLRRLGLELAAAAVIGVLLAVLLGWLVGRTALGPPLRSDDLGGDAGRDHRRHPAARPERRRRDGPAATGLQLASGRPRGVPRNLSANWCSTPPMSCGPRSPACAPTSRSCAGWTNCRRPTATC